MLYGDDLYGSVLYGNDSGTTNITPESKDEYFVDLEKYVPAFISDVAEMDAIYNAQGYEVGYAEHRLDELWSQIFVDTATWGLAYFEGDYGINSESESYTALDSRRATIKAKMFGGHTCTPERVKDLAEELTGVETMVMEDSSNYTVTLYFFGMYGVPKNTRILRNELQEQKPAHLIIKFKYRYVTWGEVKKMTWAEVKQYTWGGLKIKGTVKRGTWGDIKSTHATWGTLKKFTWENLKRVIKEAN